MPIDENCVNTLEDIIGDLSKHFRGLSHYAIYGKNVIESITTDLTEDDVKDVMNGFKHLKQEAQDLMDTIKDCEALPR